MRHGHTERKSQSANLTSDTMLAMSEVAERLGISRSMAHKLVRSGEIASYRFGQCRRVSELQLKTYIDRCLIEEQDTIAARALKYF